MKNMLRNSWSLALLFAALVWCSSCQKDSISPSNQTTAFVKYYGHVAKQTGSDLLRTDDGGYILLGSTNSYTSRSEEDIFVVRTDSLGNEIWSSSFGKANAASTLNGPFKGDYIRYDEQGVRLAKLPDGSAYTVACNRTYVRYANVSSTVGTRGQTKIVMYQIDAATGAPTSANGFELHANTADTFTESVSDMKIDSASGVIKYVLTGTTTNVRTNKAVLGTNDNRISDRFDVYTVVLEADYRYAWDRAGINPYSNTAYGFIGNDYGVSVQILPNGYLVCGTIENNYHPNSSDFVGYSDMLAVRMNKVTGQPSRVSYEGIGVAGYDFKGGQSVYDPIRERTTIVGYVEEGGAEEGSLVMLEVDQDGNGQAVNGVMGVQYLSFDKTAGPYVSASIAQLPDEEGFIISATNKPTLDTEHDICIIKVDKDYNVAEGWPYYFGYNEGTGTGLFATIEQAGTIIPVTEAISGTNRRKLTGYAFTGTFGLGTNDMLGLVKLNKEGNFRP